MATVLLAGVGPTPIANPRKLYAPGLRLWIFAHTLASHGHRVLICEAAFEGDASPPGTALEWKRLDANISSVASPREPQNAAALLRTIVQQEHPDCIVSSTDLMNNAVARAALDLPKWFDFFGHPMVERQMQARVYESDAGIIDQWNMIVPALLAGDHFSVCSQPQKFALIGELGVCGRLNRFTAGHELVDVVPPGSAYQEDFKHTTPAFRGTAVPAHDFVVLWNGGYNTWVDVKTLFHGLEYAMSRNASVRYASTGGAIVGHDERTFEEFKALVEHSPHRDRYHFFGWVETAILPNFYLEADCAVNVDLFSYEALLGCRNRVYAWINAELPILTTALSENTVILAQREMVAAFPVGDAAALGELILDVAQKPALYKEKARRAKRFIREERTNERLLEPMVRWVVKPERAPDLLAAKNRSRPENSLAELQADLLQSSDAVLSRDQEIQRLSAEPDRIRHNPLYRLYQRLRGKQ